MERRQFLAGCAGLFLAPLAVGGDTNKFQFCVLKLGKHWDQRSRSLVKLSFEIQKRCNIPIEAQYSEAVLQQVAKADSPFFVLSGSDSFPVPDTEQARLLRLVLGAGGILLVDDHSDEGDTRFYEATKAMMQKVYPELPGPAILPPDHAVYQSYYLLKQPRGRLDKRDYLEGWTIDERTRVFFSHNDLLGAMEADRLGNWRHNMEMGGGFRRELCFRLGINLSYYTLTINYKKDRAFPPIIERRRRL